MEALSLGKEGKQSETRKAKKTATKVRTIEGPQLRIVIM